MAAVVRVKRLLKDEPLDAILLNCKRRKTEETEFSDLPLAAILKFAGTVDDQDEDIFKHIKKPTKTEAEENFKKHNVDIVNKLRQESQLASRKSRYKVINCFRSNGTDSDAARCETTDLNDSYTVFDIELNEYKSNTEEKGEEEKSRFVYDLYYTQSDDFGDAELNELVSVYPLNGELVYGSYRQDDTESYDSEDSNAENNWRNDYPEEESDMESVTEDDMVAAVNRLAINEESDLSSDEGEEKYIYDEDDQQDDVSEEDVRKYGRLYAKFRAKAQRLMEPKSKDHNFYFGDEQDYYD